ncbi:leucine-rich repeat protein kinase family protein [Actinidia rufa]|uniref:non-specific serine/threonine protein kinase n=1 Tax=Actinidia rufa TaxID=165716 RepID=A0A7J0D832_9ERIC|nr:leucine-rich repeat protein kinase family protein [Actinidia rufa]
MNSPAFGFTNETDMQALLAIRDRIPEDPFRVFSSWNNSLHFCKWEGVICSHRHQRVSVLNLSSLKLAGTLSPHIGNLTFLREINLWNNSFHGVIPQEVGRLFRLQYLSLENNSFSGEFPINVTHCLDLRVINFYENNLGGKVPIQLGSLPKLSAIGLSDNQFVGTIPPALGNLTALLWLYMAANNLEGKIPMELGKLSNLEIFQLGMNKLTGTIPPALYNISTIDFIDVVNNQLHGSLPSDLGLTLLKLDAIFMGGNQFSGTIPASLANASGLAVIDISMNAFTGEVPNNLGNLQHLERLNFGGNPLGTEKANDLEFLTSLTNCTNLRWLVSYRSHFSGVLPNLIANLSTKLVGLRLDQNYISGSIPPGIGNLVNIELLALHENQLTGSIPNSIGKLVMLQELYLNKNKFSGKIPTSFGNVSQLSILSLEQNMLEGSIPVSLGSCINLQALDVSQNHLTGTIPEQVVGLASLTICLFVAQNFLTGPLPWQVGRLKNLGQLDVSRNQLSGNIPGTLGDCIVLESLRMGGNYFEGTIPSSFIQLKGILVLDLSHNNLSGNIPSFLGKFSSVQNLNLSYNMFEGELPSEEVFSNISAFSVVGNNKLCGGDKALHLPACPPKISNKQGKHFSHRALIIATSVPVCVIVLLACVCVTLYWNRRLNEKPAATLLLGNQYPNLSYAELLQATEGFSITNLIGEGTYGSVYKGILNYDIEKAIAVKVLNLQVRGANKTFLAECEALRNIRHRNLVRIITVCSSIDFKRNVFKALVFEFISNGKYAVGGEVTIKGDVYSYGILLLEMFTGKRPTDNMFTDNFNLHNHAKMAAAADRVMEIVDPLLISGGQNESNRTSGSIKSNIGRTEECLGSILRIGVICSADFPSDRMNISDALAELQVTRDVYLGKREMK